MSGGEASSKSSGGHAVAAKLIEKWLLEYACKKQYTTVLEYLCRRDGHLNIDEQDFPVAWNVLCTLQTIVEAEDRQNFALAVDLLDLLYDNTEDVVTFKQYAQLSMGLKMMLLHHLLRTEPKEVLDVLNKYFPRKLFQHRKASKKLQSTLQAAQYNFRQRFLTLLANKQQRAIFLRDKEPKECGQDVVNKLKTLTAISVTRFGDALPPTVIEQIAAAGPNSDLVSGLSKESCAILQLLLDNICKSRALNEQETLHLVKVLSPRQSQDQITMSSLVGIDFDSSSDDYLFTSPDHKKAVTARRAEENSSMSQTCIQPPSDDNANNNSNTVSNPLSHDPTATDSRGGCLRGSNAHADAFRRRNLFNIKRKKSKSAVSVSHEFANADRTSSQTKRRHTNPDMPRAGSRHQQHTSAEIKYRKKRELPRDEGKGDWSSLAKERRFSERLLPRSPASGIPLQSSPGCKLGKVYRMKGNPSSPTKPGHSVTKGSIADAADESITVGTPSNLMLLEPLISRRLLTSQRNGTSWEKAGASHGQALQEHHTPMKLSYAGKSASPAAQRLSSQEADLNVDMEASLRQKLDKSTRGSANSALGKPTTVVCAEVDLEDETEDLLLRISPLTSQQSQEPNTEYKILTSALSVEEASPKREFLFGADMEDQTEQCCLERPNEVITSSAITIHASSSEDLPVQLQGQCQGQEASDAATQKSSTVGTTESSDHSVSLLQQHYTGLSSVQSGHMCLKPKQSHCHSSDTHREDANMLPSVGTDSQDSQDVIYPSLDLETTNLQACCYSDKDAHSLLTHNMNSLSENSCNLKGKRTRSPVGHFDHEDDLGRSSKRWRQVSGTSMQAWPCQVELVTSTRSNEKGLEVVTSSSLQSEVSQKESDLLLPSSYSFDKYDAICGTPSENAKKSLPELGVHLKEQDGQSQARGSVSRH